MEQKVIIASDSTSDLSPELIERYGIRILRLGINLGGQQYTDGLDITPDMIYENYNENGTLPKTFAPNIADFTDFYEKNTAGGESLVLFTISSNMSSTYNNARMAAEAFDNVYVVDSRNLSTGGGLVVISACEMAQNGESAEEIARKSAELTNYVDASFIIDNLEFLRKGGRCSAITAFGANMFQIKPQIKVKNGTMCVGKKYRGKFSRTAEQYINDQLENIDDIEKDHIFVTHAGCDEELCCRCVEIVKSKADFKEIHFTRAGCTVSSHCGRDTLGVLFIRKTPVSTGE